MTAMVGFYDAMDWIPPCDGADEDKVNDGRVWSTGMGRVISTPESTPLGDYDAGQVTKVSAYVIFAQAASM